MTIEERANRAAELKASGRYNCTQAVLAAFSGELPLDEATYMAIGSGFAAGMGCMGSTCGALIGAVMVAGALTGGRGTARLSRQMFQDFEESCGATICRDLKGVDAGKVLCPCPECCRNAVLALGKAMGPLGGKWWEAR